MGERSDQADDGATSGWSAVSWLATRWLRRRWLAMVPAALVLAVGITGTALALSAGHQTSIAYEDYLDRADVGDLVINPSTNTQEIEEAIRTLPGVERVSSDALMLVTNDDGAPRRRDSIEDDAGLVTPRGSPDGRYLDMDRPAVQSGRLPTGPREAVVTVEMAEQLGLAVGDVEPLAFWRAVPDPPEGERFDALRSEVVAPIGVEELTIVGIVTLANEVLPDELYPRATVIVSPDVAARYDCGPPTPPPQSTLDDFLATMYPEDCATQYRYYSLSFEEGAHGVKPALEEFVHRSTALNEQLSNSVDLADAGTNEAPSYLTVTIETQPELRRVERAVRPMVAALVVLGIAAATATLGLFGLAVARELRRTISDQRQWHQLGVGVLERAAVVSVPLAAAALAGATIALAATWLIGSGPAGVVRVVAPRAERGLDTTEIAAVGGLLVLALLLVAVSAVRTARRLDRRSAATERWAWLAPRAAPPAVVIGVRAAYGQRAAVPVVVGGALLTSAFVAATVFGTSLSGLVSTSRSYGWPWDLAATTGGGYGDLDVDGARRAFEDDPDVASWTALGYSNELSLDGEPMMTMVALERSSDVDLPVLRGTLPTALDEVAIGASTASERGLEVGDTTEIAGAIEPLRATISGIVVFPSLGPLLAERVGTGNGLLVPEALLLNADLVSEHVSPTNLAAFVGVDLQDESEGSRSRVRGVLAGLDALGFPVIEHPTPVRPPEIIDADSTRSVPIAVAVVLAAIAIVGLVVASWGSARSRRREIAVLRALGFNSAQVRGSVRVQTLATMLGALVIGVPLGVIGGRVLWRAFASQLGVVPDPASPWRPILVASCAGVVIALAAAQLPAVLASRVGPAEGLRTE